jgi:hypothetical protein
MEVKLTIMKDTTLDRAIKSLREKDEKEIIQAVKKLEGIGKKFCLIILKDLLNDCSVTVRYYVRRAILRIENNLNIDQPEILTPPVKPQNEIPLSLKIERAMAEKVAEEAKEKHTQRILLEKQQQEKSEKLRVTFLRKMIRDLDNGISLLDDFAEESLSAFSNSMMHRLDSAINQF